MRFHTHLIAGLLAAIVLVELFSFPNTIPAVLFVLLGSIFPDIDEQHSRLGKLFPMISFLFRHRGLFHSIFLAVAITVLVSLLATHYAFAFLVGYIAHILLDAMTPQGVRPFWPSQARLRGFVRTGGVLEGVFFVALGIVVVWMLVRIG